jgi:hypothetical protein
MEAHLVRTDEAAANNAFVGRSLVAVAYHHGQAERPALPFMLNMFTNNGLADNVAVAISFIVRFCKKEPYNGAALSATATKEKNQHDRPTNCDRRTT